MRLSKLFWAALLATAAELAGLALMGIAAWLLLRAAEQPPISALTVAIVAVRTLALLRGSLRYAERLAGHEVVLSAIGEVRERVYRALLPHRDQRSSDADLLARVVSDVDAAQDAVLRCLLPAGVAALTGTVAVVVSAFFSINAAIALATGLVLGGVLLPWCCARLTAKAADRSAAARAAVGEHAVELVRGAEELLAYGAEKRALTRAATAVGELTSTERTRWVNALAAAGVAMQLGTTLAVCLVAGVSIPLTAALALGTLAAFEVVLPLPAAAQRWVEARASIARLRALLAEPAPEPGTADVPDGPVHLRLRGATARDLPLTDLDLPQGSRIALIGPSGSGKTTVLHVLLGLLEPRAGEVTVNGRALDEFAPGQLPRIISGATAHAHIFRSSVKENLLLAAPEATDAELRRACEAADLDCDWEHDATTLSGGQRRRLMLARAVLARPRVLVLDEPTEGLDPAHARRVLDGVLRACPGATVVLATHDLAEAEANGFEHRRPVRDEDLGDVGQPFARDLHELGQLPAGLVDPAAGERGAEDLPRHHAQLQQ
ncbi:putative ABC transporter ATP-binding protein [Amycolatopsis sp. YIM 10]|nr:putative ABC transporter ATP-binding protein [Amycolatopsis sp. YIM 10]